MEGPLTDRLSDAILGGGVLCECDGQSLVGIVRSVGQNCIEQKKRANTDQHEEKGVVVYNTYTKGTVSQGGG